MTAVVALGAIGCKKLPDPVPYEGQIMGTGDEGWLFELVDGADLLLDGEKIATIKSHDKGVPKLRTRWTAPKSNHRAVMEGPSSIGGWASSTRRPPCI